jgi:hypothetical protein
MCFLIVPTQTGFCFLSVNCSLQLYDSLNYNFGPFWNLTSYVI